MGKLKFTIILCAIIGTTLTGCATAGQFADSRWKDVKSKAMPYNALPAEFDAPYQQELSVLGWEDGIHISRDGLYLYCIYAPADLLSFLLNRGSPNNFAEYKRGPDFGMDTVSNPIGASSWLHGDILYAHRDSVSEPFKKWQLSRMARNVFTEGAPNPLFRNSSSVEIMAYTSNENPTYNTNIRFIHNTKPNPEGVGKPLPAPVNTGYNEDNPHLERIDASTLILLFDSDNRPGSGRHDLWYALSNDNGKTWSHPRGISSVNTKKMEHQPHLYQDGSGTWFLYYSTEQPDGRLAIYRVRQSIAGDWDSWTGKELVVGAGNTAGVGEPTLTSKGDISFVVVYENPHGTRTDRLDADPWFLPKKE